MDESGWLVSLTEVGCSGDRVEKYWSGYTQPAIIAIHSKVTTIVGLFFIPFIMPCKLWLTRIKPGINR